MSRGGNRDNVECKVYVGSLAPDAMEKDLEKTFGHYGPVRSVWIARNPSGFAFVEFDDHRDAEDAVRSLDGSSICGCRVRVEMSTGKVRPKPWMRGGYSGGRDSGGRDSGGRDSGGRDSGGRDSGGRDGERAKPFNPDDKCYECGQRGHYAYDCRHSGRDNDRKSRSRSPRRTTRTKSRSKSRSRSRSRSKSRSRSASRDRDAGH